MIDITGTRVADSARQASETQAAALRTMIQAIPVPVWRRDRNLALVDCNTAYAAALDTTREAVLADRRELAPASGRSRALELARAAVAGETRTERQHVVIGGSRRLIEITETSDRAGGTIGFAIDRTDLEDAEAELSRHINAHGEVLEGIHAAVAIYGADKRLKFFNSAFAGLWGIETDWLAGGPSLDELLERLRERRRIPELADFRAFKRQQMEMFTSLIEPQQELLHLPDDRTLSLSVSPHPLGGLVFVYEDVTDRLALERSYNTLIEVQRESLDNLFESIAVFGSDGRLKLHNPAYRTMWGLSEADLEGEPHITEIVEKTRVFYDDGGDWPALKERIIAPISAGALAADQLDRQDGTVLQLATVPLPDGNVLLSYQDVTDTARVERALLERNEALETAGRLKSEFIANVSYELRTPLNAVIGFAEILANQYFGPLSARQLDYSRGILASSHRLMSLINDILDLATIEAGYMVLETRPVAIGDMLEAVMTLTRERARNQDLDLSLHGAPDLGTIEADERRLKQALFNLISNAIKFTPAGGSIRLEAERRRRGPGVGGGRYRGRHPDRRPGAYLREIRTRRPAALPERSRARPIAGQKPYRTARRPGNDRVDPGQGHHCALPPADRAPRDGAAPRSRKPPPGPSTSGLGYSGAGQTLGGRVFEMQRLAGMKQRVDRVRRHRRLGEARQDQLQLARIAGDVADREDAGARACTARRIDGDAVIVEGKVPLRQRPELGRETEKRQQAIGFEPAFIAGEVGDDDGR